MKTHSRLCSALCVVLAIVGAAFVRLAGAVPSYLFVDLHPAGYTSSTARAISGGQQAGEAFVSGSSHAMSWAGTAASAADLNPPGFTSSAAGATSGAQQGGWGIGPSTGGNTQALLWSGTPASGNR